MKRPARLVVVNRGAAGLWLVVAWVLGAAAATLGAPALPTPSPVRISGVLIEGMLPGAPEADSAVRLINTDAAKPAAVGGFVLSEMIAAPRRTGTSRRGGLRGERSPGPLARQVRLPEGAKIPAGGEIWVAATATGFRQVFGFPPRFEADNTSEAVADAIAPGGFLLLPNDQGAVLLSGRHGELIDIVAYDSRSPRESEESLTLSLPQPAWQGPAVRLHQASPFGMRGQVLARDRDARGRVLADTDTAADWDSGFSRKDLGIEPTHRIERAGQTHFISNPLRGVRARALATSAPDNNHQALLAALRSARRELRVRIYELTSPTITTELVKAKQRGVKVELFVEGAPVGGISDQQRWLMEQARAAGIPVRFLATKKGSKRAPRYVFDHSKYVLIDDDRVIIGTENYGRSGVPPIPSYGNRGWMIHIDNRAFAAQLRAVWDADHRPGAMHDVVDIDDAADDPYGLPFRDPAFVPDTTLPRGSYPAPVSPLLVDDTMNLELVLSPDTSLHEGSALLGMIARARRTLYVEQNSIKRRWGRASAVSGASSGGADDASNTPNLALQAVVAAARRGVQVRVLLDGAWYNVRGDDGRDNTHTVAYLNRLAEEEGLDLVAKTVNLETTHLEKIHAKGVIVDDAEVFVGSINWTENSFKGNREVGVIVGHRQVAGYYASLFRRDWSQSRIYQAPVVNAAVIHAEQDGSGEGIATLSPGEKAWVVAEHRSKDDNARWAEVTVGLGETGFIEAAALGTPEVTATEALHVLGREAVIVGQVMATDVAPGRVQLRLGDARRPPLTAIIFSKDEQRFIAQGHRPASAFQGREVRIRGTVTDHRGRPEIVVNDPARIQIVR